MAFILAALLVAAVYCAVRWFFSWVSVMTLLWFLHKRDCDIPTEADIKEGTRWVFANITGLARKKTKL